jgi:hypothetical protein
MGKSSKQRAMKSILGKYEIASNRFSAGINIERKEINGVAQLVFSCDTYGTPVGISEDVEKQPLRKEFTDKESFVSHIKLLIEKVDKEL